MLCTVNDNFRPTDIITNYNLPKMIHFFVFPLLQIIYGGNLEVGITLLVDNKKIRILSFIVFIIILLSTTRVILVY